MRLSYLLPAFAAFVLAAGAAVLAATAAVEVIERSSRAQILSELSGDGLSWASVETDGLQVTLSGTAPDEATRFRAISIAGQVVDPTRVIDTMQVEAGEALGTPRFAIEILRNDRGISLIGLAPREMDRDAMVAAVERIAAGSDVRDLLETADYPTPEGWIRAMEFGLGALEDLPRSKISISAETISVTAISESQDQKRRWEADLTNAAPPGVALTLDISAPRPVITPFTLRFVIDETGPRFDACSAHTEEGRATILAAASAAGIANPSCRLGLGVPSPRWPDAVAQGIAAVAALNGGSVTFSDADVTLIAPVGTPQRLFDRVVGELESRLPDVFSLHSVQPVPEERDVEDDAVPEFIATLSPEGLLQLRGRITDERLRNAVEGFARARFGGAEIYGAMRVDADLQNGWPTRVLAALEALSFLEHGSAVVQPEYVTIRGVSGSQDAREDIARILSGQLGEAQDYGIEVTYEEKFDPVAQLPSPEDCVADVNAILSANKIVFAPGSANIEGETLGALDQIAEVLRGCEGVAMEVGGHTDSQGREEMNQRLSQSRAEAVLSALLSRRVLTAELTAEGYGETRPIADNETEEGREANRRIEFRLVVPQTDPAETTDAQDSTAPETSPQDSDATSQEGTTDEQN